MPETLMKNMRGLVLIAPTRILNGVTDVLRGLGCRVDVDCEKRGDVDFLILDSFYVQSRILEDLNEREQNPFVIMLATEREIARNQYDMLEQIDDIIVIPEEDSAEARDAHWNWFAVPIVHHLYQGLSRKVSAECEMGMGIPLALVG